MSAELEEKGDIAELKELGIHDDSQSVSSSTNSNQWCECNKACYRRRAKLIWRTGSLGLVVLVYLLIGAGIFTAIERPNEVEENEMITESSDNYTRLLNQLVDVLTNTTNYTRNQSIELIEAIVTFAAETAQQPLSDWEYGSSLFFVVTVVTTIGYGTTAPSTTNGRRFFIIYALIGIPITLVFLASIGEILKTVADWLAKPIERRWRSWWVKLSILVGYLCTGFILYVTIPAIIFSIIQDWTYFESVYFCFVTLTTVGFGDFVPSANSASSSINSLYRVCTALWIFIGLGFLSLVISVSQDSFESVTKKVQDAQCKCIQQQALEDKEKRNVHLEQVTENVTDAVKSEASDLHDGLLSSDDQQEEREQNNEDNDIASKDSND